MGMGKKWCEASDAARQVFEEADRALGNELGAPLSEICFNGPAERLNQTDVSQPAIYVCSIASYRGWVARDGEPNLAGAAGLSLGEYTALYLAGAFGFVDGLRLVATRGRLMQQSAVASRGGMVALIGADETQAQQVCDRAASVESGLVLVCANFNAPGQIVLSGHAEACKRAVDVASEIGVKATPLTVAGAFHSPLMKPAADAMKDALERSSVQMPNIPVWSNVTAEPYGGHSASGNGLIGHDKAATQNGVELLKKRLVEQIIRPVRWSETCTALPAQVSGGECSYHELAPGTVLRGLMRRIDRNRKVISHDEP